jgi:putative transposase
VALGICDGHEIQFGRVLEVTPSGYYAWLKQPQSHRAAENTRLLKLIRASFNASNGIYGSPRVFLDLREAGETCSKHRVARLMRENKIRPARGYGRKPKSGAKPSELAPNILQRQFDVGRPNKAWVTDITYIRTWEGWLYLAVVMDLFSRRIVGWAVAPTIGRGLVLDAVLMAVRRRQEDHHPLGSGVPVRKRPLATLLQDQWVGTKHEPPRKLLGQCRR